MVGTVMGPRVVLGDMVTWGDGFHPLCTTLLLNRGAEAILFVPFLFVTLPQVYIQKVSLQVVNRQFY